MAEKNVSDRNGRAFEYAIVAELQKRGDVRLTARAVKNQNRDKEKFLALNIELQTRFYLAASILTDYLKTLPFQLTGVVIDRLSDEDAVKGDVTDIRLLAKNDEAINISVKNNHHALKHQRPPSLFQQLGFAKKTPEDVAYRTQLKKIFNAFREEVDFCYPGVTEFAELKKMNFLFIDKKLYSPVCKFVAEILTDMLKKPHVCQNFFTFLVGNTDYIKCILDGKKVEIESFALIEKPTSATVNFNIENPNHIGLVFDNGWEMDLRLHNASKRIAKRGVDQSLKFDTQPKKMKVKKRVINL